MFPFPPVRRFVLLTSVSLFLVLLLACGSFSDTAVTPTTMSLPATFTPLPPPTAVVQPTIPAADAAELGDSTEEAIFISQPGPGSRIVNGPIQVAGVADPTFEQNLVIRLLLADGTELAVAPTTIETELGQRGPFTVEVPFAVSGEQQAFIQVYTTSARDGGITHLASVGVTLADAGAEQIVPVEPHTERIQINQPAPGDTISGGVVTVAGVALASFEQTLVVELLDEMGQVLSSQPVTVAAPDLGQPGPFSIELTYEVAADMPGRVMVRDISPAFGGDVHRASVEVTLTP